MFEGSVKQCNLTPYNNNYSYEQIKNELNGKYGFEELGEGGFGIILGGEGCVIKIIKDISRCNELEKEKRIYEIIEANLPVPSIARVPHFNLYRQFDNFCHFNIERIYSPLSGWGSVDDDDYGYGYVVGTEGNDYLFRDLKDENVYKISEKLVYGIERPGNLVHFYLNYFDQNIKVKLDQDQGILMGQNKLEHYFTVKNVQLFAYSIGQLLSFLTITCQIIPNDVEVVIGSDTKDKRNLVPFIYDFNESEIYKDVPEDPTELADRLARSMYGKNGKNYFPNNGKEYYKFFYDGFVQIQPIDLQDFASMILESYSSLFKKPVRKI